MLFGAAIVVAALLIASEGFPRLEYLAVLGLLVVFSANQRVILPDGTFISSAVMVYMASVVVFLHDDSFAGPMLIGMAGALSFHNFRRRSIGWVPFNAGTTGF